MSSSGNIFYESIHTISEPSSGSRTLDLGEIENDGVLVTVTRTSGSATIDAELQSNLRGSGSTITHGYVTVADDNPTSLARITHGKCQLVLSWDGAADFEVVTKFMSAQAILNWNGPSVGAERDAFGRQRVAEPFGIYESKNLYTRHTTDWNESTAGSGAIALDTSTASVDLTVTSASGDRATRRTKEYFSYIPGKSHIITMTGVLGPGQANTVKRIGYFDGSNGLGFQLNGTTLQVFIRNEGSDTTIDQADWNLDRMDGNGRSGIELDTTKVQVFLIDFQWLGTGRVRFGLSLGGDVVYVHEENHANVVSDVYMRTPSLPLAYEILNEAEAASGATLKEICVSISSEGGYEVNKLTTSVGHGITAAEDRTIQSATRTPLLAVRLKENLGGETNRRTGLLESSYFYTQDNPCKFEIEHIDSDWTAVSGGSWVSAGDESGLEYNLGVTGVTGGTRNIVDQIYLTAQAGNRGGSLSSIINVLNRSRRINQNFDGSKSELFVIFGTSRSGASDVATSIQVSEIE